MKCKEQKWRKGRGEMFKGAENLQAAEEGETGHA